MLSKIACADTPVWWTRDSQKPMRKGREPVRQARTKFCRTDARKRKPVENDEKLAVPTIHGHLGLARPKKTCRRRGIAKRDQQVIGIEERREKER
jgi:hypothetical protein